MNLRSFQPQWTCDLVKYLPFMWTLLFSCASHGSHDDSFLSLYGGDRPYGYEPIFGYAAWEAHGILPPLYTEYTDRVAALEKPVPSPTEEEHMEPETPLTYPQTQASPTNQNHTLPPLAVLFPNNGPLLKIGLLDSPPQSPQELEDSFTPLPLSDNMTFLSAGKNHTPPLPITFPKPPLSPRMKNPSQNLQGQTTCIPRPSVNLVPPKHQSSITNVQPHFLRKILPHNGPEHTPPAKESHNDYRTYISRLPNMFIPSSAPVKSATPRPEASPIRRTPHASQTRSTPYRSVEPKPINYLEAKRLLDNAQANFSMGYLNQAHHDFLACYQSNTGSRWKACLGIAQTLLAKGHFTDASVYLKRIELSTSCPAELKEQAKTLHLQLIGMKNIYYVR